MAIGTLVSSVLIFILIVQVVGLISLSTLPSVPCHITRLQCLSIPNDRYVCLIRYTPSSEAIGNDISGSEAVGNTTSITDLTNVKWDAPMEQNTTCYILKDRYVLDVYENIYGIVETIKGTVGTLIIVIILTAVLGIVPFLIKRYVSQSWLGYLI